MGDGTSDAHNKLVAQSAVVAQQTVEADVSPNRQAVRTRTMRPRLYGARSNRPPTRTAKTADKIESPRKTAQLPLPSLRIIAGVAFATVGVVLPLLGFGVALAVESEYAIAFGPVVKSPFDCIQLSIAGVLFLIKGVDRGFAKWTKIFLSPDFSSFWVFFGIFSFYLTVRWTADRRLFGGSRFVRRKLHHAVKQAFDPVAWRLNWLKCIARIVGTAAIAGIGGLVLQGVAILATLTTIGATILSFRWVHLLE
jgi:hypothetical protein